MQSRPNPHDAFSRQAFGSPRHIAGLLKLILPKRLRALLDLDPVRIRLHDAAHIYPALRGTASDLIVEVPRREGTSADGTERAPTSLSELIDLPDVPLDAAVRSYLPSLELVVADLAGPDLTREVLRASDAEPVSETLLEILQGASGPEASALFDEWTTRLRPLQGEPAGGSTLCAVLCYLTHVSAIPRPRISAAAEALPEPEKETFMTAAQGWMLEGLEKGRQEGRQEGERAVFAPMLLMQARLRFREVPYDMTTRIEAATKPELERWIGRTLTADRLDDLFA